MPFQKGNKMSIGNKYALGKHWKLSQETKRRMSELHKGKKLSQETKQKISLIHKGKPKSEEQKRKISEGNKGKIISLEARKKMSDSRKGKKPWNSGSKSNWWKGGVTPLNMKIRNSLEYKLWRETVFKRDNYQCIWGGKEHGSNLQADHIKPFSLFPELRFAIDNGRTLCVDCHRKTDTYGGNCKN